MRSIVNFIADDSGADIIEYALLAGLISLAAVATLTDVGKSIQGIYTRIKTELEAAPGGKTTTTTGG